MPWPGLSPSEPMLAAAKQQLEANNLLERTTLHLGHVEDLAADASYDAATLIGVSIISMGTRPSDRFCDPFDFISSLVRR